MSHHPPDLSDYEHSRSAAPGVVAGVESRPRATRAEILQAVFTALGLMGLWFQISQTNTALQQTQEALRSERRAWVGVKQPLQDAAAVGQYFGIGVAIRNSGSTPAQNLRVVLGSLRMPAGQTFEPVYEATVPPEQSSDVMMPNDEAHITSVSTVPLATADYDVLTRRTEVLFMFGKVNYDDIFGTAHETTFCFELEVRSQMQVWHSCNTYNSVS